MLLSLQETVKSIESGRHLTVAGDEGLLSKLPRGSWIGGTTPYFMAQDGGTVTKDKLFVHDLTDAVLGASIKSYGVGDLSKLNDDAPDHGFSIVIIPAFSQAHHAYAQDAPNYSGFFMKPILGWISGIHLGDLGKVSPKVFDGTTGEGSDQNAMVIHCTIAQDKMADVKMLNLFGQGAGDAIAFEKDGFSVKDCLINGKRRDFAGYIKENKIDTRLPLVADYFGALINVSFQSVDDANGVALYAPVFSDVEYKIAAPVGNYIEGFQKILPKDASPVFVCNCILNFLYSELEGRVVEKMCGPITFGEIAYQLVNQTLVYLEVY
jgi:hypothetical protein